jgi:hypothetical protein
MYRDHVQTWEQFQTAVWLEMIAAKYLMETYDVDRCNDSGLSNTEASNEATSVDLTKTTTTDGAGHEDDDTNNPNKTELTSGPETSNTIGKNKGKHSTTDTADLHHGTDVGLDLCQVDCIKLVESERLLEVLGCKGTRDETFVNTSGCTHDTERQDGEPELPVQDLWRLTSILLEREDVDWLTTCTHVD